MTWIRTCQTLLALCAASLVSHASGATIWSESTNGDLSGDRFAPSSVTLGLGSNDLFAVTGGGDLEYLTVTVPAGRTLNNLFLRSYAGFDGTAFIGLQAGSTFTEDPNTANPANLMGYTHFGPNTAATVGANILPQMGAPSLSAGQYTFWLQQLGSTSTYQFDFVTIPEPSSVALVAAGLSLLVLARRRIFRQSVKD